MNTKTTEKVRIDKYLWSIRVFKTRSLATEACDSGKVRLNDASVKPAKNVSVGEIYDIKTRERRWLVKVTGLLDKRQAYSEAVKYYEDLTPEEDKMATRPQASSFYTGKRLSKVGRPTKKDRRDLDDLWEDN